MPETIGQRLKREREYRFLTIEKASADTRIRSVFLQALEADDYSVMPSAAQGRGFLRNYAAYLELNIDELIAEIQRNAPPPEVSGPLPQVNLLETDIPPLTEEPEEKSTPPFWTRFLPRRTKAESTPEPVEEMLPGESIADEADLLTVETVEEAQPMVDPPEENLLDGVDQVQSPREAKRDWWGGLMSLLRFNVRKEESAPVSDPIAPEVLEEVKPVLQDSTPAKPADEILREIGVRLRERRELISLTFDEVERHTRLRAVFVKALEEGAFDKLPSTVQTRGMLVNYATFLDLDVDAILLRYADALQARRREKYAETPRDRIQTQVRPSMPFLRTFLAGDLIFGVLMIAALAGLAIWGVGRVVSLQGEQAQPTAPSIVDVLGDLPLPTASLALTSLPSLEPGLEVPTVDGGLAPIVEDGTTTPTLNNVTVSALALERVFLRISVDGEVAYEGRMAPGETQVFNAENQVVILTGDGSALRITYNGTDLGLMGGVGEVVSRVYLISGVVTPTATIPPTPTNTPLTTPTFTPTSTATPTATVTPTP